MTRLGERFLKAVRYATEVHGDQPRKGTTAPYVSHLLGVASFVLEDGGDEDQAIAALLHDAAEDHGGRARLEDIRATFGDRVAHIVDGCTNWDKDKGDWLAGKQEFLERLKRADRDTVLVAASDKVHNAYAVLRDLRTHGEAVWSRFTARPDDIITYYDGLVRALRQAGGRHLVDELERVVRGIKREMGY